MFCSRSSLNQFCVAVLAMGIAGGAHVVPTTAVGQHSYDSGISPTSGSPRIQTPQSDQPFDGPRVQPLRPSKDLPTQPGQLPPIQPLRTRLGSSQDPSLNGLGDQKLTATDYSTSEAVQLDQAPPQLAAKTALEKAPHNDRVQSHATLDELPDWLIRPSLLSPLNSLASEPGDLIGTSQERSQVIVLWVQPGLGDHVLTLEQLKQVAQQQPIGAGETTKPNYAVSQASYQEQDQEKKDEPQEPTPTKPTEPQTTQEQELTALQQQVATRRAQLKANESLEAGAKSDVNNQLNLADEWIQKASASNASLKSATEASDAHIKITEELNNDLKKDLSPETVDTSKSQEDLNAELKKKEADLDLANIEQKSIRQDLADLENRKIQIPKDKKAAETALNEATKAIEQLESQPDSSNKANSLLVLRSKRLATTLEVKALAIEATRVEQRSRTLPLKRDLVAKKIRVLETEIKEWRAAADKKRNEEIDRQREEAIAALLSADPEVKKIAETNQALVAQRSQMSLKTTALQNDLSKLTTRNDNLEQELTKLKDRISTAGGVTSSSGILLVEHRRALPPTAKSQQQLIELAFSLSQSQTEVLRLNEQRAQLINDRAEPDSSSQGSDLTDRESIEQMKLKKEKKTLKETQLKIIDDLIEDHRLYREKILDLEEKNRDLITNVAEAKEFIDENALWVRSAERIGVKDIGRSFEGFRAFFNQASWQQVINNISSHVSKQPYEAGLLALVIGSLFVIQRRLRWSHE